MKFIRTAAGEINVNAIVRIAKIKGREVNEYNATVWYQEGDEVRSTSAWLRDDIAALTRPVVPTLPGFFVAQVVGPDPYELHRAPVVAWRIDTYDSMPVTAGADITTDSNEWGVLCPDGRVVESDGETHESEDAFLRAAIERLKARKVRA